MTIENRRFGKANSCQLILILSVGLLFISIVCWTSMSLIDMVFEKVTTHDLPVKVEFMNDTLDLNATEEVRYFLGRAGHDVPNITDQFIQNYLNCRENDTIETTEAIINYIRLRKEKPEFFMTASQAYELNSPPMFYYQEETTPEGNPILYMKIGNWNYSHVDYATAMATAVPFSEIAAMEGRNTLPAVTLFDMRDWTWSQSMAVRPASMKLGFELIEKTLPIRQGGKMHVLHQSWVVDMFFSVGKSFMTERQLNAMVFHGDDLSDLFKEIPVESMPKAIGGKVELRHFTKPELAAMDERLHNYWKENGFV
ncbi:Retinaldehyde-binding protein 1 [Halotydeus destructor]|nr:Retinaldehyde-binding protein 1 [Halotydeus destructor]